MNSENKTTAKEFKKGPKNWVRLFWKYYLIAAGIFLLFILMLNFGWIGDMPDLDDIENPTASLASQVYAQDGTPMGKFYLEDRISVKYRDISPYLLQALVATEDKRFYDHYGIDGEGLLRAVAFLGSQGGASTITMQTAKNLFTDNWGTKNKLLRVIQKIKESGTRFCPHYLGAGIGLMASAHVLAAAGGDGLLEIDANDNALRSLLAPPLAQVVNGYITLDEKPGLGVTPDLEALQRACVALSADA